MNQKQLEVAIRSDLLDMLKEQGIELPILAAFPPSKQGRVDDGIYFFLLSKQKRGWQSRSYSDTKDKTALVNTETQINEFMFQFNAFIEDNGLSDGQLLAEDVLSVVRGVMQSIKFADRMQAQGIGVQRATDIVTPTFINEKDNYEHNPSFTIIFTQNRSIQITTPKVDDFKFTTVIV